MKLRIRRRWLVTLLVGAVAFGVYVLLTRHRIDEAHFKLIEEGMTYAEVKAIFGAPPGNFDWAECDYVLVWDVFSRVNLNDSSKTPKYNVTASSFSVDGATANWSDGYQSVFNVLRGYQGKTWTSRHGSITITFDEDERVVLTSHQKEVLIVPPWQRVWRWWKAR